MTLDDFGAFAFSLVAVSQRRIMRSQFASPFQAYLAGATLHGGHKQFMGPRSMVGMMSALKYIMKCIVFYRVDRESLNDGPLFDQ